MLSLRYLSPLVLALGLAARPSQAQQADLTPMQPVRTLPRLPTPADQVVTRKAAAPAATTAPPPASPAAASEARRWPALVVVLNSRLIAGLGGMGELDPRDIEKIEVYKSGGRLDAVTPAQWRGLAANGLIAITLKKNARLKLPSQTLAQLGRRLRVRGPVSYTLNGLPAVSGALRLATVSIEEIKLTPTAAGTTVGVWLREQSSRPTKTYPPGTIMIRGMASR